ncbi:hypothetical protein [Salisediminibacterium halotolerans]|uniref:hypothetical protein n=1 Tax=Salisediminibacterium halotolerans TaxID=517425 RepID=UPI000EB08AE2|nr:hypothetical protein [Salisediminibacterium halotolerans]RLJ72195.1 hypothetical protein BCL39_2086 [Actinophytocola xinjiangensis]RPE85408.1 hypothetical protein EDD67_2221 [Salisediminibacterium halotolerans]TWG33365.1 hypothetical protein BCL52_2083 [Salisediminibacterium halotolerans]GEL07106.1 hypothetical protein SHA02_05220 [Salisediminibacterium halotolerans]
MTENNKGYTCEVHKLDRGLALELPQEIENRLGIKAGDKWYLDVNEEREVMVIKKAPTSQSGGLDEEFLQVLNQVLDEHEEVLQRLKKR